MVQKSGDQDVNNGRNELHMYLVAQFCMCLKIQGRTDCKKKSRSLLVGRVRGPSLQFFKNRKIQNKVEPHLKRTRSNRCREYSNSNQPALCINKICARSSPLSLSLPVQELTSSNFQKLKFRVLGVPLNEFCRGHYMTPTQTMQD